MELASIIKAGGERRRKGGRKREGQRGERERGKVGNVAHRPSLCRQVEYLSSMEKALGLMPCNWGLGKTSIRLIA